MQSAAASAEIKHSIKASCLRELQPYQKAFLSMLEEREKEAVALWPVIKPHVSKIETVAIPSTPARPLTGDIRWDEYAVPRPTRLLAPPTMPDLPEWWAFVFENSIVVTQARYSEVLHVLPRAFGDPMRAARKWARERGGQMTFTGFASGEAPPVGGHVDFIAPYYLDAALHCRGD